MSESRETQPYQFMKTQTVQFSTVTSDVTQSYDLMLISELSHNRALKLPKLLQNYRSPNYYYPLSGRLVELFSSSASTKLNSDRCPAFLNSVTANDTVQNVI